MVWALSTYEASFVSGAALDADAIAAAAFDLEAEIAALTSTIRPYLLTTAGRAITSMDRDYGLGGGITVDTDFVRQILQAQESRFAADVTDTSVRGIRDQIAEAIANGEGFYQIRDRILAYYERQKAWRAGLAAQYETGEAFEAVRDALARNQGMTRKHWNDMGDDKVEAACRRNSAIGWINIDQAFPSGASRPLQHPL